METRTVSISDPESWRTFFARENASVGVEMALPWIDADVSVSRHIRAFVGAIMFSLARLGARLTPRQTWPGQDFDPRELGDDVYLFSHHSIGNSDSIARFKHSYRMGHFTLDLRGYAGYSDFARNEAIADAAWSLPADDALTYLSALRSEKAETNDSKYQQPAYRADAPEPGFVFLALQMPGDTVMKLCPTDPVQFYRAVVSVVASLGRRCVIKRHPLCSDPGISAFLAESQRLPGVEITDLSVNQLLPRAERVVVVNSTVGMEALIYGKHTSTFAPCEYGCVTTRIKSLSDVATALNTPSDVNEVKVAQFVQFFFERYCLRPENEDAILSRIQHLLAVVPPRFGWSVVE